MGVNAVDDKDYSLLKDLKLDIRGEPEGTFSLCFWLYLINSTSSPSILLRQVHPNITGTVPFLVLNEKKALMLFPLLFLHQEAPSSANSTLWAEVPHTSSKIEFPLKKWLHVGCEVSIEFMRLYIDGEIVGEKPLASLSTMNSLSDDLRKVSLTSSIGHDDGLQGYVHCVEFLPLTVSIQNHYVKVHTCRFKFLQCFVILDPPLQLLIDSSSASEIKEDSDGVWSIVGGKERSWILMQALDLEDARVIKYVQTSFQHVTCSEMESCRRNFSLDVILLDALGQPVNKEMEVVALLLYADSEAHVEKPDDAEAPLLTNYDGIEYASCDRPSKLINGRASFKLKISQLSSKCDNKLFRLKFEIPKMGKYPFLQAFSIPIRCVSRNRTTRVSSPMLKKSSSAMHLLGRHQSLDNGSSELVQNIVCEAKQSTSSKRVKLGQEKPHAKFMADLTSSRIDEECNSQACTSTEDDNAYGASMDGRSDKHEETDNSSDLESSEATNSVFKSMPSNRDVVSDLAVFKYCLGGLTEKSLLLKEIAISASEQELADFAEQVSLYMGCLHHR
ncbi:unnamed protein product [Ilex paraguariensis]|uniref:Uncharacterized protein n=1 Tax=Ilex paraguariensis TaxID=185542 RepID=A0ABC8QNB1_9AQUA